MRDLSLVVMNIADLRPRDRNPRTHSKKQIQQIADSIRQFGFTNPVLIDDQNNVVAGHGRVAAAKLLGMDTVPVIRLSNMSKEQIRAYVIADNKLAENAGWDRQLLALELQDLAKLDLGFDLTITGFETGEIDVLIGSLDVSAEAVDQIPEISSKPAVSRPGDLWMMGRHRLLCGDATKSESFSQLTVRKTAQMVFIDPPYNVPVDGHVCGLGQIKHAEFAMEIPGLIFRENVRIRSGRRTLTDIDFVAIDPGTATAILFQLKHQDGYGGDIKKRNSRSQRLLEETARWLRTVTTWLEVSEPAQVSSTFQIKHTAPIRQFHTVALCRNFAHFLHPLVDEPEFAYANWIQLYDGLVRMRSQGDIRTLSGFFRVLRRFMSHLTATPNLVEPVKYDLPTISFQIVQGSPPSLSSSPGGG